MLGAKHAPSTRPPSARTSASYLAQPACPDRQVSTPEGLAVSGIKLLVCKMNEKKIFAIGEPLFGRPTMWVCDFPAFSVFRLGSEVSLPVP
jgi:hypothetical protein